MLFIEHSIKRDVDIKCPVFMEYTGSTGCNIRQGIIELASELHAKYLAVALPMCRCNQFLIGLDC